LNVGIQAKEEFQGIVENIAIGIVSRERIHSVFRNVASSAKKESNLKKYEL
jgi:hypothetical protein